MKATGKRRALIVLAGILFTLPARAAGESPHLCVWDAGNSGYQLERFCESANLERVRRLERVLLPAFTELRQAHGKGSESQSKSREILDKSVKVQGLGGSPVSRLSALQSTINEFSTAELRSCVFHSVLERLEELLNSEESYENTQRSEPAPIDSELGSAIDSLARVEQRCAPRPVGYGQGTQTEDFTFGLLSGQPSDNPTGQPYSYPASHELHLDPELLGKCLAGVTRELSATPKISRDQMNVPYSREDFEVYLRAKHRFFDYGTGKEDELRAWVLAQPDNSIDPVSIYRKALSLAQGNVWNAFLTIHQLLRVESRWWAPGRYRYASSSELEHRFFNKFIDLRGDLKERGKNFKGDHEGTWYRIWGVALAKLFSEDEAYFSSALSIDGDSFTSREAGRKVCKVDSSWTGPLDLLRSGYNVAIDRVIEYEMTSLEDGKGNELEADHRKAEIDTTALRAASAFLKALTASSICTAPPECASRGYLK